MITLNWRLSRGPRENENSVGKEEQIKMAESLRDILGISMQEAESYFEMAGGDLETAISMFYEMGGSDGGMVVDNKPQAQNSSTQYPPWYTSVWPERKEIDKSWLEQGISFSTREVCFHSIMNQTTSLLESIA